MQTHQDTHEEPITSHKTLLIILGILILLTAVTIAVSEVHLGGLLVNTLVALSVASIKATFVLLYFMHLKYESVAIKWTFLVTILTLVILIGLMFVDLLYRTV